MCAVETDEWLRNPGTVGKCLTATVHICDDDGEELPAGEPGTIFFEPPEDADLFEYHGDRRRRSVRGTRATPAGAPSATSATWTRTTTSSSPTARRS